MMINKQSFLVPHPALRHVVNHIIIGSNVTNDLKANLSFQNPPLPGHSIYFFPYDRPTVENAFTKLVKTLFAFTIAGPQTERNILSLGHNHLIIKIGFQSGVLYRFITRIHGADDSDRLRRRSRIRKIN